jgi:hypothetical protein
MSAWWAVAPLVAVICAELSLWAMIRAWRPRFQWLTTRADEAPQIDDQLIENHRARGFDPELGWVRKPGDSGIDQTIDGPKSYAINQLGCRQNPGFEGTRSQVAVFGDSYAFCRLVSDQETWPHLLSQRLNTNVHNYGVGNYGLDQALLRFERELPDLEARIIVMAVVPETIVRIHSYWKHYFEYGNILAFKPRFTLDDGDLCLHDSVIRDPADYKNYAARLAEIQRLDPFYQSKFLRDLLVFPVLPRVLTRASRHGKILWHLATGSACRQWDRAWRKAFGVVLQENARYTSRLYQDPEACALFKAIIQRFILRCEGASRFGVLVIIPQPMDLERQLAGGREYRDFFRQLGDRLPVVDLTEATTKTSDWQSLFIDGRLGPHLSANGNRLVADVLAPQIERFLTMPERTES